MTIHGVGLHAAEKNWVGEGLPVGAVELDAGGCALWRPPATPDGAGSGNRSTVFVDSVRQVREQDEEEEKSANVGEGACGGEDESDVAPENVGR
ncbi:hypothetical protein HDU96_010065 [Phlyctochytrium bullatum]|nr:hypothetical protein HDU96_010065 [Phlyctochytrium bullatum]